MEGESFFVSVYKEERKLDKKKYYITTAIAYTSGKPHIGNTYEAILADSIARLKDSRDMTCFSRQEQMNTVRKSN